MNAKQLVLDRLRQAIWQLGRELATAETSLPDGRYSVVIDGDGVKVEDVSTPARRGRAEPPYAPDAPLEMKND